MPVPLLVYVAGAAVLSLIAGCENYYEALGKGSKECTGKDKDLEPNVTSEPGYVTAAEEQTIKNQIRAFKEPLWRKNPSLFCQLNGWHIGSKGSLEVGKNQGGGVTLEGYYDSIAKTILVSKHTDALESTIRHEFCHYLSDRYGILNDGAIVSKNAEYGAISCVAKDWNQSSPENCIINPDVLENSAYIGARKEILIEEEFAWSCNAAELTGNLPGERTRFSSNPNTRMQVDYFGKLISLNPEPPVSQLNLPKQAKVTGEVQVQFNANGGTNWLGGYSIFQTSEGAFGYSEPTSVKLFLPPSNGQTDWKSFTLPRLPIDTSGYPVSFDYRSGEPDGTLFAWHKSVLYGIPVTDPLTATWSAQRYDEVKFSSEANLFREQFISVDKDHFFLGKENYWFLPILKGGLPLVQSYPKEIKDLLRYERGTFYRMVYDQGTTYLWLEHIPTEDQLARKGVLFQLNSQKDTLEFKKVFEIPTAEREMLPIPPIRYKNAWHYFIYPTNSYMGNKSSLYGSLAIARVDNGGISPYELRYSNDSKSLHIRMNSLVERVINIGNNTLLGFSEEDWKGNRASSSQAILTFAIDY